MANASHVSTAGGESVANTFSATAAPIASAGPAALPWQPPTASTLPPSPSCRGAS